ncbi:MAG: hypothetical protein ACSHWW_10935 [Nonlabens sp.]|uniref:hypothetical protein n=1 Tax=Nonlabens sp. TaxID=1888209 RepID=UPI003EF1D323
MKKVWGIIGIILIITGIVAGRLYLKNERSKARQEQQISQEDARELIQSQREAEIKTQLAEQARVRDSAYAVEQAARDQQLNDLKALREQLEKEAESEKQ